MHGVVSAGHPLTAEAGAVVLRAGGNAVDAALAAMLTSFVAEPLLNGLGAGGYLLFAAPDREPVLLDFFVEAPGRGRDPAARAPLVPVDVSFGDAVQVFNVGAASCGVYGTPAGVCEAHRHFATMPLTELAAPAARLAREGVRINPEQAHIYDILSPITGCSPEARAELWVEGHSPQAGDVLRDPALADSLERLGAEGEAPFYDGDIAAAVVEHVAERGGMLTAEDLRAYAPAAREPVRAAYRGREVLTNPPPSAGGILIAYTLARLDRSPGPASVTELVAAMEEAQQARTPSFIEGLARPGFQDEFLGARLGNTTHLSVLDAAGGACAITCTNGEGSGVVVPGTGLHLNNMMGEQDLSPLGYFSHPPGRRLPSMMAPTVVLCDGRPELVLGSAGSNRIRSAILQVVLAVLDGGLAVDAAVDAPRLHWEDGVVYAEPGIDIAALEAEGRTVARFRDRNVFFGGVQAVRRDPESGALTGAGDPRRGGVAVTA
jgi:gamma-glutamyltranspeptidase/glutathione hydrolase